MRFQNHRTACVADVATAAVLAVSAAVFLAALPASCGDSSESPATDNPSKTLSTLRKIDDYPLYVLRYYGDYGFSAYLRERDRGESPPPGDHPVGAWGCTTFSAFPPDGEYVLARNFDWYDHMALLLYTDPPDGWASVSMVDLRYLGFTPNDASAANLEKLLSAPYWPFDGMNEHGVAIGMMAVPRAEGGDDPEKPTIGSLAAIRLVLDHAKTVEGAVSLLSGYNVDFSGGPPVHYLVSDPSPRSAVIEFIDNEMVVIPSNGPWQVATNFIVTGYPFDDSPSECWRYNVVYHALEDRGGVIDASEAMALLEDCSQPITMWSVVYSGAKTLAVAAGRRYSAPHRFTFEELKSLR